MSRPGPVSAGHPGRDSGLLSIAGAAAPFAGLLVYVAAAVALGALLAFPVHAALPTSVEASFDSVLRRVAALTLLLLLPFYLAYGTRAARFAERFARSGRAIPDTQRTSRFGATRPSTRREAFGFGCSPRAFRRAFFRGVLLGAVIVSPLVAAFLALGIRAPIQAVGGLADVGAYLASALVAAAIIGIIEEAYFRGALLVPLRHMPAAVAVSSVSVVYAAVHFLGAPVPADVSWTSGLSSIARSEVPIDQFLALVAAGLFLGALRCRCGHVALGAGFHAGWVFIMKLTQEFTDIVPSSEWLFLGGAFGGTMGWLGLAWIALLGAGWYGWERTSAKTTESNVYAPNSTSSTAAVSSQSSSAASSRRFRSACSFASAARRSALPSE